MNEDNIIDCGKFLIANASKASIESEDMMYAIRKENIWGVSISAASQRCSNFGKGDTESYCIRFEFSYEETEGAICLYTDDDFEDIRDAQNFFKSILRMLNGL